MCCTSGVSQCHLPVRLRIVLTVGVRRKVLTAADTTPTTGRWAARRRSGTQDAGFAGTVRLIPKAIEKAYVELSDGKCRAECLNNDQAMATFATSYAAADCAHWQPAGDQRCRGSAPAIRSDERGSLEGSAFGRQTEEFACVAWLSHKTRRRHPSGSHRTAQIAAANPPSAAEDVA